MDLYLRGLLRNSEELLLWTRRYSDIGAPNKTGLVNVPESCRGSVASFFG
jgi:hypothetical protein